jgi:hypothetical protein
MAFCNIHCLRKSSRIIVIPTTSVNVLWDAIVSLSSTPTLIDRPFARHRNSLSFGTSVVFMTRKSRDFVFRWNSPASLASWLTGSSRLDPGFYGVLVRPCQLFVRLRYRVSDVLDLSLVSKRFGFWPHITHVIMLTFKEIKHVSDYRTVELSDCRIIGRTPKL